MSLAVHPMSQGHEVRIPAREADDLAALLSELGFLARLSPAVVKEDVRALVWSLRDRRKTCYRCATETIGRRRPKRGQRTFCEGGNCAAEQSQEDHARRAVSTQHR